MRTDFTNDRVILEVEDNGGCVTRVEHLLEAVVADESRGTVVALAISRSIIAAQGGTLEAIRREGEVTGVRIELPRFQFTVRMVDLNGAKFARVLYQALHVQVQSA